MFECCAHHYKICARVLSRMQLFAASDATPHNDGQINGLSHRGDGFTGHRQCRTAACIKVNAVHAQLLAGHGRCSSDFGFITGNGRSTRNIARRGGFATIDEQVTGRYGFKLQFANARRSYHVLPNEQLSVSSAQK